NRALRLRPVGGEPLVAADGERRLPPRARYATCLDGERAIGKQVERHPVRPREAAVDDHEVGVNLARVLDGLAKVGAGRDGGAAQQRIAVLVERLRVASAVARAEEELRLALAGKQSPRRRRGLVPVAERV